MFEEQRLFNLLVASAVTMQNIIVIAEFILMCCSKVSLCRKKLCHELERAYGHFLFSVTKCLQCQVHVTNLQFKFGFCLNIRMKAGHSSKLQPDA